MLKKSKFFLNQIELAEGRLELALGDGFKLCSAQTIHRILPGLNGSLMEAGARIDGGIAKSGYAGGDKKTPYTA